MISQPDWLETLKSSLLEITREAARTHWPGPAPGAEPYYNYRFEHVRQVERDALRLLAAEGGDHDVLLASVWIHDRGQPQYEGENHAQWAAGWAVENLVSLGFPAEKVDAVVYAVARHSDEPGAIPLERKEARLLWDADKLSKVGLLTVITFLAAMPAFPDRPFTLEGFLARGLDRLPVARELAGRFYTPSARRMAAARYESLRLFYTELAREVGKGLD